jgi:hypothetical protein
MAVLFALALCFACPRTAAAAAPAPWLFVSDIHLEPAAPNARLAGFGHDTNGALLDAAIAEMRRVDPRAPVVVIDGDYLGHTFHWADAETVMSDLARRFDAAFPHAQFVIALGNEDSDCGDYETAPRSAFLRAVARAWEPLVNRGGAAPAFAATFARDGSYTARLPVPGLRAVIIDDVYWSWRYHSCLPVTGNPAAETIDDLRRGLRAARAPAWVVLHIPPGIDAFSSAHLAHRLAVVPFLKPRARDALLAAPDPDPATAVDLADLRERTGLPHGARRLRRNAPRHRRSCAARRRLARPRRLR